MSTQQPGEATSPARPAGAPGQAAASDQILVNGEHHPLPPQPRLRRLLDTLGISAQTTGVAVAVNGEVVPRADWDSRTLSAGDEVEVVRAVPGG
ncbi:MAG TPA: sulfur carrier protein ThiS [Chloroflexota bacterium]|nr:sulfur carrier protein ThiS [Chloroflexota bacterium]